MQSAVAAAFTLPEVLGASWEKNILAVEFADGSIGGLHVPRNEDPDEFVAALEAAVPPVGGDPLQDA